MWIVVRSMMARPLTLVRVIGRVSPNRSPDAIRERLTEIVGVGVV